VSQMRTWRSSGSSALAGCAVHASADASRVVAKNADVPEVRWGVPILIFVLRCEVYCFRLGIEASMECETQGRIRT
jgi:hypothetical protein